DGTASDSGPQYSYQWVTADGNIVSGANTLTPVIDAPGTYELIVVNQENDCEAGDQVLVEEDANQPVAAAMEPEDLTCAQTQVTIDASPSSQGPNYQYSWQVVSGGNIVSGANSLALSVDAPGIYELTVLNTDNGCEESIQVEVEENTVAPEAQAAAPQLITCTNTAVPLDGSGSDQGANYSYQWMTTDGNIVSGATSLNPIVDQTGTYILEVYNAENGCTQTASVSVGEDLQPPILSTEEPEELNCAVEQTPLSVIVSGPAGATFSYAWTTADGQIVSGADQPQPLIAAPGTYEVLVTNENNGCEETAQVQVFQDITPPVAEAGNAAEITCDNAVVSLNGAGSSSGANFTYLWSGSGLVSGENTLTPQVNEAGSYQLTVTNEDNHCTSADVVVVSENTTPPVVVLAEADPITCAVETVALNPAGTDAGANFSWLWSTPDGQFYDLSDPQAPIVNAPGTYILEVENDLNGCVETAQVQVQEDKTEPGAEAGPDLELNCHLTQVNLNAQANVQGIPLAYSWTTTGGNILNGADEQDPLINAPGLYEVTVTNLLNGCTSTDALTVTENMPQAFDFETDDPGCAGQTGSIVFQTVIGGAPPYLYSVDNGQSFSSSPVFNNLEPGAYDLVVMDANDCPLDDVAFIPEGLEVLVDLEAYVLTSYGETTILNAITNIAPDDIEEIIWSPTDGLSCTDCLNPSAQPDETTYYFVTIRTKDGCEADAKVLVVVDKQAAIYVPNAFSPNGDGNNDLFMIFAGPNQVEKVRNFLVFNRWGETVFEYHNFDPNNPAYGWDGTFRGQPLNPAVFTWYAEIEFKDGRVELFEGDVQLVR
ncbi:MAG TPA: T9SS type B sorting domain-containing protein, partial [Phaeodactylibacter sp.]|nr:T9SS type B sorting domain-containing protein [Phaeodactylibacter sp.]